MENYNIFIVLFLFIEENMLCNHGRAYFLFAEAILNKKAFRAQKCATLDDAVLSRCFEDSTVYMGQADTYKYDYFFYLIL